MSQVPRQRLVFERWTDPAAGDILELTDIDVIKLDLQAPVETSWAALESAHGYQVATRTDVSSVIDGEQWLAGPGVRTCWRCARRVPVMT
jgi:D-3-phosphoglycerate dehydrogenase / 2-oxoglutarate reductase